MAKNHYTKWNTDSTYLFSLDWAFKLFSGFVQQVSSGIDFSVFSFIIWVQLTCS